jgi:multidrug efflux pump subunit AcrA (membrane-fusion protein)
MAMKYHIPVLAKGGLCLWPLLYLWLFTSCDPEIGIKPNLSTMTESVYASVLVQPEDLYDVYATKPGVLEKVLVKEGDEVKSGQVIAQVRILDWEFHLREMKLNLELAQENYSGAASILTSNLEEIRFLEKQYKIDSVHFQRQEELWKQGIGSKLDLETRRLKYESSLSKLTVMRKKQEQAEFELANKYQKSKNALNDAKSDLRDYFIRSAIDGTIYTLKKTVGEVVQVNEPLAQIGKSDSFLIEMMIDEVDIAKIALDQRVLINLDAYGDQVFEAKVIWIYPKKDDLTQTFRTEAIFLQPPERLFAGLSGEANIILGSKENVLTVPSSYLINDRQVKTIEGNVDVVVGLKSMDRAEILTGIDTSTILLKP